MSVLAGATVAAGGVGFALVMALIVAGVFLFRSLNRHLKNLPASFDPPEGADGDAAGPPPLTKDS